MARRPPPSPSVSSLASVAVLVASAAVLILPRAAPAQGLCQSVLSTASIDGCSSSPAGFDFGCQGPGASAQSVTTDGNCWLVATVPNEAPGGVSDLCTWQRNEPTLLDAPGYWFEARLRVTDLPPECLSPASFGCEFAVTRIIDGQRAAAVTLLARPTQLGGAPGGLGVGFYDSTQFWSNAVYPLDITVDHTYRVEVDRLGEARYYVDGALLHAIPYQQLPPVPATWAAVEHYTTYASTSWLDYLNFDVCGSMAPTLVTLPGPASQNLAIAEVRAAPRQYFPGQGRLGLTTLVDVARSADNSPHNKNASYQLNMTQSLTHAETGAVLATRIVTAPVDLRVLGQNQALRVPLAWSWDGVTPSGTLAPEGLASISSDVTLKRIIAGSEKVTSSVSGLASNYVGLWAIQRAWTRPATPVFHRVVDLLHGLVPSASAKLDLTISATGCTAPVVPRFYAHATATGGPWQLKAVGAEPALAGDGTYSSSLTFRLEAATWPGASEALLLAHTAQRTKSVDTAQCTISLSCPGKCSSLNRTWSATTSYPHEFLSPVASAGDLLQSALRPAGATDTVLFATGSIDRSLKTALTTIYVIDDDSGVGPASRLSLPAGADGFMVAAKEGTASGQASVYLNDVTTRDSDADGLGDSLEAYIRTCSSGAAAGCEAACLWGRDTDCDGIPDGWEVLGQDDATLPQQFPQWGANPRHKDVFVEVDYQSAAPRLTEDDAVWLAERFESLDHQLNPDGKPGVALHLDLGQPCPSRPSLCGNWGGSSNQVGAPTPFYNQAAIRQGLPVGGVSMPTFHWALVHNTDGGSDYVGEGDRPGRELHFTAPLRQTALHMLGHNLGLTHWGTSFDGVAERKPNYPSVMNYSYLFSKAGGADAVSFSSGDSGTLWPDWLSESSYSAGTDLSFLAAEPYAFTVQGSQVDWNRDGEFEPWGPVKAHVYGEPLKDDYTGLDQPIRQDTWDLPPVNTTLGPAFGTMQLHYLADPQNNLWVTRDRQIVVANVRSSQNPAAANFHLSKRDADISQPFGQFLVMREDMGNPSSPPAEFHPECQPAVVRTGGGGGVLCVVGVTAAGNVRYTCQTGLEENFGQPWASDVPTSVVGQPGRAVSLKEVAVTSDAQGALHLVGVDQSAGASNEIYYWYQGPRGTFADWHPITVAGFPLRSEVTPGLTTGPNGKVYLLTKGVSAGDPLHDARRAGRLDLYMLDPQSLAWQRAPMDDSFWLGEQETPPRYETLARPSLAFARHRSGVDGGPMTNGALWAWWAGRARRCDSCPWYPTVRYRWSWGPFNDTTPGFPENMGKWHWPGDLSSAQGTSCYGNPRITGIGLYPNHEIEEQWGQYYWGGRVMAVVPHQGGGSGSCAPGLTFVPHADGLKTPFRCAQPHDCSERFSAPLRDHDDRPDIRRGVCESLHHECPARCVGGPLTGQCGAPLPSDRLTCNATR